MVFATVEEVKENAIFRVEMTDELSDPQIQRLIDRARRQLIRRLGQSFEGETDVDVLFDLNVANIYLVDVLYIMTRADVAHLAIQGVQSETKGKYVMTLSAHQTELVRRSSEEYESIVADYEKVEQVQIEPTLRIGKTRRGDRYVND